MTEDNWEDLMGSRSKALMKRSGNQSLQSEKKARLTQRRRKKFFNCSFTCYMLLTHVSSAVWQASSGGKNLSLSGRKWCAQHARRKVLLSSLDFVKPNQVLLLSMSFSKRKHYCRNFHLSLFATANFVNHRLQQQIRSDMSEGLIECSQKLFLCGKYFYYLYRNFYKEW